jgi:hypothetical protein
MLVASSSVIVRPRNRTPSHSHETGCNDRARSHPNRGAGEASGPRWSVVCPSMCSLGSSRMPFLYNIFDVRLGHLMIIESPRVFAWSTAAPYSLVRRSRGVPRTNSSAASSSGFNHDGLRLIKELRTTGVGRRPIRIEPTLRIPCDIEEPRDQQGFRY